MNPSIGHLIVSETPIESDKWKEYIQGFYNREFNCYVKHQIVSEKEVDMIRDSLTNIEIEMLQ